MNKSLKLGNAEVEFSYLRQSQMIRDSKQNITKTITVPKTTKVTVITPSETLVGVAVCSPRDNFNYEMGRKIALRNAFATSRIADKATRKAEHAKIWSDYNKLKKGGRW